MTQQMVVGIVILALGIVLIAVVAVAKAEPFAYLSGVLVGELGAMLLVMGMVSPGTPRTVVALFFAISIAWTTVQLLKASPKPGRPKS